MHKIKQVYKDLWSQDLINATIPQESYLKSNRKKKKILQKKAFVYLYKMEIHEQVFCHAQ